MANVLEPEPNGYNTDLMSYDDLSDLEQVDDQDQRSWSSFETGYRPDGQMVYVKEVDEWSEDAVQSHIAAGIFLGQLEGGPEIAYDEDYARILVEARPGEPVESWQEYQMDPLHEAAAKKLLMGDTEYQNENFVAEGNAVSPIDFDETGRNMRMSKIALSSTMLPFSGGGETPQLEEDLLHMKASEIADQVDLRQLEEDMAAEPYLMDSWNSLSNRNDPMMPEELYTGATRNIIDNVRMFQRSDLNQY